jgi:hypothetical protein
MILSVDQKRIEREMTEDRIRNICGVVFFVFVMILGETFAHLDAKKHSSMVTEFHSTK